MFILNFYMLTENFQCVETLNFDGGFAFSVAISNLPGSKGYTL